MKYHIIFSELLHPVAEGQKKSYKAPLVCGFSEEQQADFVREWARLQFNCPDSDFQILVDGLSESDIIDDSAYALYQQLEKQAQMALANLRLKSTPKEVVAEMCAQCSKIWQSADCWNAAMWCDDLGQITGCGDTAWAAVENVHSIKNAAVRK